MPYRTVALTLAVWISCHRHHELGEHNAPVASLHPLPSTSVPLISIMGSIKRNDSAYRLSRCQQTIHEEGPSDVVGAVQWSEFGRVLLRHSDQLGTLRHPWWAHRRQQWSHNGWHRTPADSWAERRTPVLFKSYNQPFPPQSLRTSFQSLLFVFKTLRWG